MTAVDNNSIVDTIATFSFVIAVITYSTPSGALRIMDVVS